MYLTIYVDDIIIACVNLDYVREMKAKFCSQFDMTDMDALEHFLNVRVTRSRHYIQLDQSVYTSKVLEKFVTFLGPTHRVRKSPPPSDAVDRIARVEQELSDADQTYVGNFPYRSLLGALLYLSMNTRPDVAYAVRLLSRFGSKPTLTTCHLITYLMQYV